MCCYICGPEELCKYIKRWHCQSCFAVPAVPYSFLVKSCIQDPGPIKCIIVIWSTGSLLVYNNIISVYLSLKFGTGRALKLYIASIIVLNISI